MPVWVVGGALAATRVVGGVISVAIAATTSRNESESRAVAYRPTSPDYRCQRCTCQTTWNTYFPFLMLNVITFKTQYSGVASSFNVFKRC